jgi:hypothetical protein
MIKTSLGVYWRFLSRLEVSVILKHPGGSVMKATNAVILIGFVLALGTAAFCVAACASGEKAVPLKLYVSESKQYALYKPELWKVREETRDDAFRILVSSPDGNSSVDLFWARNDAGKPDALRLLLTYQEYLGRTHANVLFSEVFLSSDSSRAVAAVRYQTGQSMIKGRYFFESKPKGVSVQGYCAPESRLTSERSLLLNVMASMAFSKTQTKGKTTGSSAGSQPQFVRLPLVARQASDGSLSIKVPADWQFLGGGGKVVTSSPDGGMGVMFTSFSGNPILRNAPINQGVIGSQYLAPVQTLTTIFNGFGNKGVRILSAQADHATDQQFLTAVGRRSETQDLMVRWDSPSGTSCVGAFKVVNALPNMTGLWFSIVTGIWGPEKDFYRFYPMLESIGSSFSINDQFARQYIQSGLANLRRLQQETMAAMQDLNRAREQNQSSWEARQERKDFMDSNWDDYWRGQTYWVSELEGGKVYSTDNWGTRDTSTGQYYEGKGYKWTNFEGQNPNYPSENMHEVSSYELKRLQMK